MSVVIDTQGFENVLKCSPCGKHFGYHDHEVEHWHPEGETFHGNCGILVPCPSCGTRNFIPPLERHRYLGAESPARLVNRPTQTRTPVPASIDRYGERQTSWGPILKGNLESILRQRGAIRHWLSQPNPELGGQTPDSYLEKGKEEEVNRVLVQTLGHWMHY